MNISFGSCRMVILFGDHAVKIGRIRPIRLFFRIFVLPFSKSGQVRFLQKYGGTWKEAIYGDLFAGLFSNRNEYEYFQKYRDGRVMPTVRQFLNGHVILQVRGKKISMDELEYECPPYRTAEYMEAELSTSKQFCRHPGGRIKIVDYGNSKTINILQKTFPKVHNKETVAV